MLGCDYAMKATSSSLPAPEDSVLVYGVWFQWGAFLWNCPLMAILHRRVLFTSGLYSSRAQRLWEPVPGSDWQRFRLHRHTRPARHHQLLAWPAVQVQLQLPVGISGQQHPAGLVSLVHLSFLTPSVDAVCVCWEVLSGEEKMMQTGQNEMSKY